jgi:hypothetical protein
MGTQEPRTPTETSITILDVVPKDPETSGTSGIPHPSKHWLPQQGTTEFSLRLHIGTAGRFTGDRTQV